MAENTPPQGIEADESSTLGKLAAALAKAQAAMHNAEKTANNPGFNRKYATLAAVWDACREPLAANGLAVVQRVGGGGNGQVLLTTDLIHESGEFVRSRWSVPADMEARRNVVQALVSSTTYARRCALAAIVGVAVEDDDGEAAGAKGGKRLEREEQRDPAPESGSRPTSGAPPATFPNFGKAKGEPIRGAATEALEFHLGAARKSLADPEKAKWHARDSALIGAIEAELARQAPARGMAQTPATTPTDAKAPRGVDQRPDESEEHAKMRAAGAFYAKAVKAGANAGWDQASVGKWLRDNRNRGGKSEVTAEDAELFCRHLEPPPESGAAG